MEFVPTDIHVTVLSVLLGGLLLGLAGLVLIHAWLVGKRARALWFLIGHENSFLHQKVFFRLEPRAKTTLVRDQP